jgi:hypothetical protein
VLAAVESGNVEAGIGLRKYAATKDSAVLNPSATLPPPPIGEQDEFTMAMVVIFEHWRRTMRSRDTWYASRIAMNDIA